MRTKFIDNKRNFKKKGEGVSRKFSVFLPYKYSIEENLTNYTSVRKTIRINYFLTAEVNVLLLLVGRPVKRLNFQNFQISLLKYNYRITSED